MKGCDLCKSAAATMYCDSDQASLCWDCDAKVHSANFLVARHSRSLLCHVCQSPTPWNASGEKLGRTASVCEGCCVRDGCGGVVKEEIENAVLQNDDEESDGGYDGEEEEEEEDDGDDEEGENQVVPWTPPPPPMDESSSSSEESSIRFCNRQFRQNAADLCSDDDDHGCSSARRENISPVAPRPSETVFVESLRPLKRKRIMETIVEICNRSKNPGGGRSE